MTVTKLVFDIHVTGGDVYAIYIRNRTAFRMPGTKIDGPKEFDLGTSQTFLATV